MIRATTTTDPQSLAGLEPAWRGLEAACRERFTFFQSFDWCAAWAARYVTGPVAIADIRIITVWEGDDLLLLWPGMVSRGPIATRLLQTLGTPHTQYATALARPGIAGRDDVRAAFRAAITEPGGADVALFDPVPEGAALSHLLDGLDALTPIRNETAFCRLASYASFEAYLSGLSADQRKSRKRKRNRIAALPGHQFRVLVPEDNEFAPLVETCVAWKRRWLAETGRVSGGFALAGYDQFLGALAVAPADDPSNRALLFVLEAEGRPLAIELGYLWHNHYYSYLAGFDWQARDLSPGKVAMEAAIRWLIEAGAESYDLLGNPAEYKASWTDAVVPLQRYVLPITAKGRLIGGPWLGLVRPALKEAYGRLPETLRRRLAARALSA